MTGDDNPLAGRVCIQMMAAQVLGPGGEHPVCLGTVCSSWEECTYTIGFYREELTKLKKKRSRKKPRRPVP